MRSLATSTAKGSGFIIGTSNPLSLNCLFNSSANSIKTPQPNVIAVASSSSIALIHSSKAGSMTSPGIGLRLERSATSSKGCLKGTVLRDAIFHSKPYLVIRSSFDLFTYSPGELIIEN